MEFSLCITILLLVVFASIEFVRLNMIRHSVEHGSYLAARRGIITGATVADVTTTAQNHLATIGINNGTVTVTPNPIDDNTQIVEVVIDAPVAGNTWISPVYFQGMVSGRTRMLAERASGEMVGAIAASP